MQSSVKIIIINSEKNAKIIWTGKEDTAMWDKLKELKEMSSSNLELSRNINALNPDLIDVELIVKDTTKLKNLPFVK